MLPDDETFSHCHQAVETLKTFEKKDSRVKSAAATNLSFLYFLVGETWPSGYRRFFHVCVFNRWVSLQQEKDYDQADRYSDLAMSADRYNPAALINKGNTVFVKQDHEKAAEFYKEALRNDSSCTEALYNLGKTASRRSAAARLRSVTVCVPVCFAQA